MRISIQPDGTAMIRAADGEVMITSFGWVRLRVWRDRGFKSVMWLAKDQITEVLARLPTELKAAAR